MHAKTRGRQGLRAWSERHSKKAQEIVDAGFGGSGLILVAKEAGPHDSLARGQGARRSCQGMIWWREALASWVSGLGFRDLLSRIQACLKAG